MISSTDLVALGFLRNKERVLELAYANNIERIKLTRPPLAHGQHETLKSIFLLVKGSAKFSLDSFMTFKFRCVELLPNIDVYVIEEDNLFKFSGASINQKLIAGAVPIDLPEQELLNGYAALLEKHIATAQQGTFDPVLPPAIEKILAGHDIHDKNNDSCVLYPANGNDERSPRYRGCLFERREKRLDRDDFASDHPKDKRRRIDNEKTAQEQDHRRSSALIKNKLNP